MGLFDILGGIGALGSLYEGAQSNKLQKKQLGLQQQVANRQMGLFDQASPYYNELLNYYALNAGLPAYGQAGYGGPQYQGAGTPGYQAPGQPREYFPGLSVPGKPGAPQPSLLYPQGASGAAVPGGGPPGAGGAPAAPGGASGSPSYNVAAQQLPAGALGPYGQNPADLYRFGQAEDQINQFADARSRELQRVYGERGIGGPALGGALQANEQNAYNQLAGFRRNLAINAGLEQERRVGELGQMLNPGLGAGPAAASIYSNLGGQYGNMAAQNYGALGQIFNAFGQMQMLKKMQGAYPGYGQTPGITPQQAGLLSGGYVAAPGYGLNVTPPDISGMSNDLG